MSMEYPSGSNSPDNKNPRKRSLSQDASAESGRGPRSSGPGSSRYDALRNQPLLDQGGVVQNQLRASDQNSGLANKGERISFDAHAQLQSRLLEDMQKILGETIQGKEVVLDEYMAKYDIGKNEMDTMKEFPETISFYMDEPRSGDVHSMQIEEHFNTRDIEDIEFITEHFSKDVNRIERSLVSHEALIPTNRSG